MWLGLFLFDTRNPSLYQSIPFLCSIPQTETQYFWSERYCCFNGFLVCVILGILWRELYFCTQRQTMASYKWNRLLIENCNLKETFPKAITICSAKQPAVSRNTGWLVSIMMSTSLCSRHFELILTKAWFVVTILHILR